MPKRDEGTPFFAVLVTFVSFGILAATAYNAFVLNHLTWKDIQRTLFPPVPCAQPIPYSIGSFDPRFNISRQDFSDAIDTAAKVWNDAAGKDLLVADATGGELAVNLVYDTRQQATQKLQSLGIVLHDDRASYDALKAKYDALDAQYQTAKKGLDARIAALDTEKASFASEVKAAQRGGVSAKEYRGFKTSRA